MIFAGQSLQDSRRLKLALSFGVLGLLAMATLIYGMSSQVTLVTDNQQKNLRTMAPTVGRLLEGQGVQLGEFDRVEPDLATPITGGMIITVHRAFPVEVQVDGDIRVALTTPTSVAEVLALAGVTLSPQDRVEPDLEAGVQPGDRIRVIRVTTVETVETKKIPFKTEITDDSSLEKGIRRIAQRGKEGQAKIYIRITYEDGVEVGREVVRQEVIRQPVNQVVAMGTIQMASRGSHAFRFKEELEVVATAYTHTGNKTFTGVWPKVGTVAVDPRVIPLGSRLYVEGYGFGVAQDTGGFIKGNRIDVFLETEAETRRWGRKPVKVYILN